MAYYNVTARWLREKISEFERMSRLYQTSAQYETYFARIAADIGTQMDQAIILRARIDSIMQYLKDLEARQDSV